MSRGKVTDDTPRDPLAALLTECYAYWPDGELKVNETARCLREHGVTLDATRPSDDPDETMLHGIEDNPFSRTRPSADEALRVALRKEMGWSDHEIDGFITEYALATSSSGDPCSVEPAFSLHEYAVDYCETHDQPADQCATRPSKCGMIHGHISHEPCTRPPGHDGYPIATRPSGDEALRAALDSIMAKVRLALVAGDVNATYSASHVALLVRRAVDDTFAALATPSSTPDVDRSQP